MIDISSYAIGLFAFSVVLYGAIKRTDCFGAFLDGANEGLRTCLRVLPTMAAMLIAIAIMRQSGLMDFLVGALTPIAKLIGLPEGALPVAVIRPFSGGAALGVLADTLATYGPDSDAGRAACIIMSSSETLFYAASLYFGSVGIKNWRHTIPAGLVASVVGVVSAALLIRLF